MDTTDVLMSRATRSIAYKVYSWSVILIGAVLAGFAAMHLGAPDILIGILAGMNFVGGALGFIADANVPKASSPTVNATPATGGTVEEPAGDGEDEASEGTRYYVDPVTDPVDVEDMVDAA